MKCEKVYLIFYLATFKRVRRGYMMCIDIRSRIVMIRKREMAPNPSHIYKPTIKDIVRDDRSFILSTIYYKNIGTIIERNRTH